MLLTFFSSAASGDWLSWVTSWASPRRSAWAPCGSSPPSSGPPPASLRRWRRVTCAVLWAAQIERQAPLDHLPTLFHVIGHHWMALTKRCQIEDLEKNRHFVRVLVFLSCILGAKNAWHGNQKSNRKLFQIFGTEIITDIEKVAEDDLGTLASMEKRMVGEEVTVCTIKTGVDDFLDFLAVTVTILIPTLIGIHWEYHHGYYENLVLIEKQLVWHWDIMKWPINSIWFRGFKWNCTSYFIALSLPAQIYFHSLFIVTCCFNHR